MTFPSPPQCPPDAPKSRRAAEPGPDGNLVEMVTNPFNQVQLHTHTHTHTHPCTRTHTTQHNNTQHTQPHTHTHKHTHTYTYTHIHIHTHTHIYAWMRKHTDAYPPPAKHRHPCTNTI